MKNLKTILILIISLFVFTGCNLLGGKQFNVSFMVDGEVYYAVTEVAANITEPTVLPEKQGYEFNGWYFDEGATIPYAVKTLKTMQMEDVFVYAHFLEKHTLSFESNCSVNIASVKKATVDTLPSVTNSGYSLLGWYYDSAFTTKVELPFVLEEDTTIYARWIRSESIVTYYLDGELYDTETVSYNEGPSLPNPDLKPGHSFSGWKTSNGQEYVVSGYIVNDLALYATFNPNEYTIYYSYGIAQPTVVSATIVYGTKFTNLPTPSVEGYTFSGWYYNGNKIISGQTVFNFETNITLVANFTIKNCSVKFYDQNSQEMSGYTYQVQYGTDIATITFPTVINIDGYNYVWLIDNVDNIPNGFKVNDNLNIYLNYNPIMYMITYDYGDSVTVDEYIYYNEEIDLPSADKYGYIFNGWKYDGSFVTAGTKYNYLINITLLADYTLDTFTITFYDIDGDVFDTRYVEYTHNLTDIPAVPTVTGYSGEWCTYNGNLGKYQLATFINITNDVSIYAVYIANEYKATYKVNGNNFDVVDQKYGSVIKLPEQTPQLQNKVFIGWYYNSTEIFGNELYLYTNDIVITARFVDNILSTPVITYNADSDILSWSIVDYATNYKIYANNEFLVQVDGSQSSYKLSNAGLVAGTYSVYVVACGSNGFVNSADSNIVTVVYTTSINEISVNSKDIVYYTSQSINLQLNSTTNTITWNDDSSVEKYIIFIINENETKSYVTQDNHICIYDIVDDSEISGIRIGAKYAGSNKVYLADDLCYYNPVKLEDYGNTVYLFDGQINDFYISSMDELNNIMYYSFTKKFTKIKFLFDENFVSQLETKYSVDDLNSIQNAISEASNSFSETMYLSSSMTVGFDGKYYYAEMSYNYYGVYQCNVAINAYDTYPQDRYDAIYEIYNGTKRLSTYNNYVSDQQFLYTVVNTSEELYWAVENGFTPVFTSTDSRAYIIYNNAKVVLNSIIYEEMTDYEKALAIFDWISLNTVYNYTSSAKYQSLGYNGYSDIPSYYLEGVFLNHYAVCDGFSKAFSLMCNMEGIDAIRITGEAYSGGSHGGHAWNKVIIDDECYIVDITWTEIIRSSTTENLTHEYFLVSEEYVATSHFPHANRSKYFLSKYNAQGNHKSFYENVTYLYNSKESDFVISNDVELKDILDFVVDGARTTIEIMFDYNYLKSLSGYSSITSSQLQLICSQYINPKLNELKFTTLFIEITSNYDLVVYNSNNDKGLFYVLEFHMMVDEISDIEALLSDREGTGTTYDLVLSISLLTSNGYATISGSSLLPSSGYSDLYAAIYAFMNSNVTGSYNYNFADDGYYYGTYCYLTITF